MGFDCLCQKLTSTYISNTDELLEQYASIRSTCSALTIVHPDDIWEAIRKHDRDKTQLDSIFLTAHRRGYLHKLTRPIHHFLFNDEGKPRNDASKDYLHSYAEKWLFKETDAERLQKAKMYYGKPYELLFAYWLTEIGCSIEHLEALGKKEGFPKCDIVAFKNEERFFIEVKYIGKDTDELNNSLQTKAGPIDLSKFFKYIDFRVAEAAKQIEAKCTIYEGNKIGVILLDKMTGATMCYESPHAKVLQQRLNKQNLDGLWLFGIDGTYEFISYLLDGKHMFSR